MGTELMLVGVAEKEEVPFGPREWCLSCEMEEAYEDIFHETDWADGSLCSVVSTSLFFDLL